MFITTILLRSIKLYNNFQFIITVFGLKFFYTGLLGAYADQVSAEQPISSTTAQFDENFQESVGCLNFVQVNGFLVNFHKLVHDLQDDQFVVVHVYVKDCE